ncbi:MAG: TetR/AcrR family transcriptional regulator [Calditrichaceae bacterium]|nr:TetR/AcrR family transcriptional regulator [Calditrichaceae bacterium]
MNTFTEKQLNIINAAIELIAEKGIQQMTIKNLSKKIGTVDGAIYRHFDSKIEILLGILKLFRQNKDGTLQSLIAQESSSLQKLEGLLTGRFRKFSANPAIAAVIFSEEIFQNEKSLADEVFKIMQDSQNTIETIILKGQSENQIRNDISADQLALLITGALRLIVTKWRLTEFSFDLQTEGQKLWKSIYKIVTN